MKQEQILVYSYIAAFATSIIGAFVKIMHGQGAETLLIISLVFLLVFMVSAIREVSSSQKIPSSEKTMWIMGFIFMSLVAGLIYFKQGRRRVIG
jgi:uncharacterized membrane protein HdeD (DUF308 family)